MDSDLTKARIFIEGAEVTQWIEGVVIVESDLQELTLNNDGGSLCSYADGYLCGAE